MGQASFTEGRGCSWEEFFQSLGVSDDDYALRSELKKTLVAEGVVNGRNASASGDDDEPSSEEKVKTKPEVVFSFVGVVECCGVVVKCLPKYVKTEDEESRMQALKCALRAIERYHSEHDDSKSATAGPVARISNRLALAWRLVKDYFLNGLYSREREERVLLGQGEVDWETTINTSLCVIQKDRPCYFDYYTTDTFRDDADYITRLHACIITECSEELKRCELDQLLDLQTPCLSQNLRMDFGTDAFICQRLRQELCASFSSQKQELLRNLLSWVDENTPGTEKDLQMFGTSSFHAVWEDACKVVFDSHRAAPLKDLEKHLGRALHEDFRARSMFSLETLMPKPRWMRKDQVSPDDASTLRPDFLRVEAGYFVILDAKYYDVSWGDTGISGQPGIGDVLKQFAYKKAYEDFCIAHDLKPLNAFVFPTGEDTSALVGTVTLDIFPEDHIHVIMLSAPTLLNHYVNHNRPGLKNTLPEELFQEG